VVVSKDTIQSVPLNTTEPSAVGKRGIGLTLSQDSGFILKKDGLRFLLSVAITDTSGSGWSQAKDNDTIGRFYKVKQTGNFFVCTIDLSKRNSFETHLLLEIKADGTVLKNERFFHGNYSCCWHNYYEGFNKIGDFFCIKTCVTGSGYCGTHIYIFKEIKPQEKQNSIVQSYWSSFSGDGLSQNLNSTIEWNNDYLLMHYELEKGKFDEKYTNFRVKRTDKFDVKYILKNAIWIATDSTKLRELDI
jgi:hypothetical protein